jgi:hypothetical protein
MADNVNITESGSTVIATDQLADTSHVQYVKLMDGTLNGTTKVAAGANGLATDVKASVLPTGAATAAKQDTGNASLATLAGCVSAGQVSVDVDSVTVNAIGPTSTEIKFARVDVVDSDLAPDTIVAAVEGKKIRVLSIVLSPVMRDSNECAVIKFLSSSTVVFQLGAIGYFSTAISGSLSYPAVSSSYGLFETVAGQPLIIYDTGDTGTVCCQISYVEV